MKDKSTDELFDPRINLKNGILEIRRPLIQEEPQQQAAVIEDRHLPPIETREIKPVRQEPLYGEYSFIREPKPASKSAQILYPGELKTPAPSADYIDYPK